MFITYVSHQQEAIFGLCLGEKFFFVVKRLQKDG